MKDDKNVSPSYGQARVKKMNYGANIFFVLAICSLIGYQYYNKIRKENIYNALYMTFDSSNEIEYGTQNVDTVAFVRSVEYGKVSDYPKEIDTSSVGIKKLTYELSKEDVSKEFVYEVEVVDTKLPVISLNKDTIYVYVNNNYDIKANVKFVVDEVDGDLKYVTEVPEENIGYYTISTNYNKNKVGTYNVDINAVDKNGNTSNAKYTIKVINRPQPKTTTITGNYNGKSSVDTSSVVNAAKSLLGSRYKYGGASPSTGFDCSGFVQYIYGLFGKSLGRSTGTIAYNGQAVARSNMQPGDIIVWSTLSNNSPTHVSIYIGGDTMIHAANSRKGVISSSVSFWEHNGGGHIVTIRRV